MTDTAETKPRVQLVGLDGNCFAILACCRTAARRAGWSEERWEAFKAEATSGDYDQFLGTVLTHFDAD